MLHTLQSSDYDTLQAFQLY